MVPAQAGIHLPRSFALKSILTMAAEILGLSREHIRARAAAKLGEPTVKHMETGVGLFQNLLTHGPAGVWDEIKDQVGDLKDMILGPIMAFVEQQIVVAGVEWIMSMLTPASAFIRACKAIYDIVTFFIQRAGQIVALASAVIDAVSAIASGSVGAVAAAVENALTRSIPVVIGGLASLLGIGGLVDKVRGIIAKVQAPVNHAIDWVIGKAASLWKVIAGKAKGLAHGVAGKLGYGKDKDKHDAHAPHAARHDAHDHGVDDRTSKQKQPNFGNGQDPLGGKHQFEEIESRGEPKGIITKREALRDASLDESQVNKHLPDTPQANKLHRKGDAAHVFTDRTTMESVIQAIKERGEYLGQVRGHERWGLQFDKPIGYRIAPDSARVPLNFGELKVQGGVYHAVPRTRAAR